jgi:hypothetical protein
VTTRQDLDGLVDGMEPAYASAESPITEARAVAAAALSSAYLLADALDRQIAELKAEVTDLRRQVETLRRTGDNGPR